MDDSPNSDRNEELSPMLSLRNPHTKPSRNVHIRSQILSHAVPRGLLAVIEVLFKLKNFGAYSYNDMRILPGNIFVLMLFSKYEFNHRIDKLILQFPIMRNA